MTKQQQRELNTIKTISRDLTLRQCLKEMSFWRRFNDDLSLHALKVYERRCKRLRAI